MPTPKRLNVAVVGATGMVGREMLRVLAQRAFPTARVKALASERSRGGSVAFNGSVLAVEELGEGSFIGVDVALFSAGADTALTFAPLAAQAGALVVDNSSAWRMADHVPLVVPEVNGGDIADHQGIIANPNCCAIPLAVVLEPLRKAAGLRRVVVATYQSASGAGRPLVEELEAQTRAIAAGASPTAAVYPHQLAHNVVPGGWRAEAGGYNEEELKIVNETRKILHEPELRITATCVRVPVPVGHGEAVFIELESALSPADARRLLERAPGIKVQDDPESAIYPTPLLAAGQDDVFVGRLRADTSVEHGLSLFLVSDNLRKGAAVNAVQIAEQALAMDAVPSRSANGATTSARQ